MTEMQGYIVHAGRRADDAGEGMEPESWFVIAESEVEAARLVPAPNPIVMESGAHVLEMARNLGLTDGTAIQA